MVDEIMSLSRTKQGGKATAQQLLMLYQNNLGDTGIGKDNDDEDPSSAMTISMIHAALTLQKAVKDVPSINAVLIEASEVLMERSPFFSITNTWAMAKKSKTNDELQWIMEMIFDICIIFPQTWTIRRHSHKNAVGVLDVMLSKRELKVQLLDKKPGGHQFAGGRKSNV